MPLSARRRGLCLARSQSANQERTLLVKSRKIQGSSFQHCAQKQKRVRFAPALGSPAALTPAAAVCAAPAAAVHEALDPALCCRGLPLCWIMHLSGRLRSAAAMHWPAPAQALGPACTAISAAQGPSHAAGAAAAPLRLPLDKPLSQAQTHCLGRCLPTGPCAAALPLALEPAHTRISDSRRLSVLPSGLYSQFLHSYSCQRSNKKYDERCVWSVACEGVRVDTAFYGVRVCVGVMHLSERRR